MAEDEKKSPTTAPAAAAKAKAKKEKPPAPEDKPFGEFIQEHYLPTLATALTERGFQGTRLSFEDAPLALNQAGTESYWQVSGQLPSSQRQFSVVFTQEDIKGPKFFYCTEGRDRASTIEQFMGDERKITLDLMVLYVLQRLNGQKWLVRN
ncbi:DUF2996 domain-containing protein [Leptolyngbya sp. PCC 6406]|uniref:DUF2996 domain-containing protein n=1 Tax=Leptolyngbya sp. PCC 6406 TaxID=1173264 RepID=UPI0002AC7621|nr:DUF2996 domain-containing protein [Leptolyngbya sp. PCC 6406]